MFISKHCNICLKSKKALFNIVELDSNNVSYHTKLKFAVPEIEWNHNNLICFICVEQLNATYNFKELCLKSFNVEIKTFDSIVSELNLDKSVDSENDNTNKNNEYIQVCGTTNTKNLQLKFESNLGVQGANYIPLSDPNNFPVDNIFDIRDDDDDDDDDLADIPLSELFPQKNKVEKSYVCDICDKVYKHVQTLKSHYLALHTDKSEWNNDCYACDKVFARKSTLTSHIKRKHFEKGTFVCSYCNQAFTVKHMLVFHIREQHLSERTRSKRSFDCNVCNQVFSVRNYLYEHAKTVHGIAQKDVKPYRCDVCDKRFKVSTYLISHKLYHEGKRTNMCNFCGKGFVTLKDLKIHETYHSDNFTYCCPECGQTFKNHKLLYAHKVSKHVAPENWKFVCNICSKRFPRVSGYKMHMRRHLGDKRFMCHLCDKKFVSKFQLLRHIESHSNVRRFRCEYCDKEYREKRIFNIHLFDVHGIGEAPAEKKVCNLCSMSFSCNYKLRRHMLKHSKPFGCSMCEKRYPDNYHLKLHLQRKHKVMELPDDENKPNTSIEIAVKDDFVISSL